MVLVEGPPDSTFPSSGKSFVLSGRAHIPKQSLWFRTYCGIFTTYSPLASYHLLSIKDSLAYSYHFQCTSVKNFALFQYMLSACVFFYSFPHLCFAVRPHRYPHIVRSEYFAVLGTWTHDQLTLSVPSLSAQACPRCRYWSLSSYCASSLLSTNFFSASLSSNRSFYTQLALLAWIHILQWRSLEICSISSFFSLFFRALTPLRWVFFLLACFEENHMTSPLPQFISLFAELSV